MRIDRKVAARDAEPGMVMMLYGCPCRIERVERAADFIDCLRQEIAKPRLTRARIETLAEEIAHACAALDWYGREARLIWAEGVKRPFSFTSQETLEFAPRADRVSKRGV